MTDVKSYFDVHSHHTAYHKDPDYYLPLANTIEKIRSNKRLRILDIGCGDGSFIKGMLISGINADFTGIDVSTAMINIAKMNLEGQPVNLLIADGFKLPLSSEIKFDLIHIDMVLHHIIKKTRRKSLQLANHFLDIVCNLLSNKGVLIVEEMYYNSYVLPYITSSIVFYSLKILNLINLDISRIMSDIKPGLEVNFFYNKQLFQMLGVYGNVNVIRNITGKVTNLQRLLLLKEIGTISYMIESRSR